MGVKKKRVDGGNFKQVAQRCSWLKTDNCYWQLALLLSALLCPSFCRLGFCGDRGSLRQCLISGFVECRAQPDIYRQALSRVTFVNAAYWGDIGVIAPVGDAHVSHTYELAQCGIERHPIGIRQIGFGPRM